MTPPASSPVPPWRNPTTIRLASYWGSALALLTITAVAVIQGVQLRSDLEARERRRLTVELTALAERAEQRITLEVAASLLELANTNDPRAIEAMWRDDRPWALGGAIWRPGEAPVWPPPAPLEPGLRHPCVARAAQARTGHAAWLACLDAHLAARVAAGVAAATTLPPVEALDLLDRTLTGPAGTPGDACAAGVAPLDLAAAHVARVRALVGLGRASEARRHTEAFLTAVVRLDLACGAGMATADLSTLASWGPPGALEQARRVLLQQEAAWALVTGALSGETPPSASALPAAVALPEVAATLAWANLGSDRVGALLLDQAGLLRSVAADLPPAYQARPTPAERPLEVPAGVWLPGGSLAAEPEAHAARLGSLHGRLPSQTLPMIAAVILSLAAMVARIAADRREGELLERQREFTARVTHELKTPLAGIRVMAEGLQYAVSQGPEVVESFASRIVTEVDRLSERVDQVLRMSRAPQTAERVTIDLADTVAELVKEWTPRMRDQGVVLHADVAPVGKLVGDAPRLRDAVAALLDNALKYRRPDHPDRRVWVRLARSDRMAVLEVEDNGLGVPAGKRRVIFERFARVEGPGRGKAGGHGLGLSFAAEAVQAHGGRIECLEGPEGGARFVLRLPLRTR